MKTVDTFIAFLAWTPRSSHPQTFRYCCYSEPDHEVGGAETSWGFDGHFEEKSHMGMVEAYGKRWHVGDVVGVFLDLVDRTIRCVIGNHELLCNNKLTQPSCETSN